MSFKFLSEMFDHSVCETRDLSLTIFLPYDQQELQQSTCVTGDHGTSGHNEVDYKTEVVLNHSFFLVFFHDSFQPLEMSKKVWAVSLNLGTSGG